MLCGSERVCMFNEVNMCLLGELSQLTKRSHASFNGSDFAI